MSDVSEVLEEAALLLEDRGWDPSTYLESADGRLSLLGALDMSATSFQPYDAEYRRVLVWESYETVRDRLGVSLVTVWEEKEARGLQDVLGVLRE